MLADTFLGANSATTNILTLQSTTRNQLKVESGSTLEFWRSAGVESARFDANGNFLISATSASARLQVRGDGTNRVVRFDDNSGNLAAGLHQTLPVWQLGTFGDYVYVGASLITNGNPSLTSANSLRLSHNLGPTAGYGVFSYGVNGAGYWTSGTGGSFALRDGFAAAAGSGNWRTFDIQYTLNNSGAQTGTATGIFLNATETALNGMTHNLIDLQVGGVSRFLVSRTADTTQSGSSLAANYGYTGTNGFYSNQYGTKLVSPAIAVFTMSNIGGTDFNRLQFGGTTNAFPALKRSGTTLLVRYADDSGYGYFESNAINITHNEGDAALRFIKSGANQFSFEHDTARLYIYNATTTKSVFNISNNGSIVIGGINNDAGASALFQMDSTTKGFLPPRMTTTQVNAIASPAEGLVVFNTTISHLCVYQGGAWVRINHSPM
jgi:hypothetical protein